MVIRGPETGHLRRLASLPFQQGVAEMDERTPWPDAEAKSLGPQIAGKDDAELHHVEGQKADSTTTAPDAEAIYGPTRPETEVQAVEVQAVAAAAASVAPDSLRSLRRTCPEGSPAPNPRRRDRCPKQSERERGGEAQKTQCDTWREEISTHRWANVRW